MPVEQWQEWLAFVEAGRIEELFRRVSLQDVAVAWSRHTAREFADNDEALADPDWWAVELWHSSAWWQQPKAVIRDGLVALVDAAESDEVLGVVGAGPLEEFVSDDEEDVRWIEEVAARKPRFRQALANVWADVSEDTWARFDRAAGTPLARPSGF